MQCTRNIFFFTLAFLLFKGMYGCTETPRAQAPVKKVKTGAEVLIQDHLSELKGKKVGLVMNSTARIGDTHMLDTLLALSVQVTALFAPEHGFRGDYGAGEQIEDGIDQASGLPVYSLYGRNKKPTGQMLENVDVLLFDMQDVGARFYTYNVTLGHIIEAAAEHEVSVWVLDRPNPAGNYVAGWILREPYKSFIGNYPIPVTHGMTLGELGGMMIGEQWLDLSKKTDYRVIPLKGWDPVMLWPETGLTWWPPSPNLPGFKHALVYLGTAFFEGTTMSEGRGTSNPFLWVGDPQFKYNPDDFRVLEKRYNVNIDSVSFTPTSIPGKALNPKHKGVRCFGVKVSIPDVTTFKNPVAFGLELMKTMLKATEGAEIKPFLYNLAGNKKKITKWLQTGTGEPATTWQHERSEFLKLRESYLLYSTK